MEIETVAAAMIIIVFIAGLFQIAKWVLQFGYWLHEKMYVVMYGERVTPYCLFKLEDWNYTPYKVIERYKR